MILNKLRFPIIIAILHLIKPVKQPIWYVNLLCLSPSTGTEYVIYHRNYVNI